MSRVLSPLAPELYPAVNEACGEGKEQNDQSKDDIQIHLIVVGLFALIVARFTMKVLLKATPVHAACVGVLLSLWLPIETLQPALCTHKSAQAPDQHDSRTETHDSLHFPFHHRCSISHQIYNLLLPPS